MNVKDLKGGIFLYHAGLDWVYKFIEFRESIANVRLYNIHTQRKGSYNLGILEDCRLATENEIASAIAERMQNG